MLRTESEHDCYGAGHAGTALSAALGMAVARDLAGGHEHVDRRRRRRRLHQRHLVRSAQQHRRADQAPHRRAQRQRVVHRPQRRRHRPLLPPHRHQRALPATARLGRASSSSASAARPPSNVVRRAEEAAKSMLWPSILFEEFGLQYFGPIDGHNLPLLIETFKFLKTVDQPVLLHILTQKGRGFQPALDGQKKFHGLGPYDPETGKTSRRPDHLLRGLRQHARPTWPTKTRASSPSPRPCPTAPASISSARIIPSATSTSASPKSTPSSSPPAWPRAASAPSAPSTPPSCSAPSIPSSTTSACRSSPWSSAWTAPASPATTAPPITASSTSATCAASPRWC